MPKSSIKKTNDIEEKKVSSTKKDSSKTTKKASKTATKSASKKDASTTKVKTSAKKASAKTPAKATSVKANTTTSKTKTTATKTSTKATKKVEPKTATKTTKKASVKADAKQSSTKDLEATDKKVSSKKASKNVEISDATVSPSTTKTTNSKIASKATTKNNPKTKAHSTKKDTTKATTKKTTKTATSKVTAKAKKIVDNVAPIVEKEVKKVATKTKKKVDEITPVVKKEVKKTTTKVKKTTKKAIPVVKDKVKKVVTKAKKKINELTSDFLDIVEYYDLPYRYNQTVVKVLAQNPNTLFVYWDVNDIDVEHFKDQYGDNFLYITKPVLVVHNVTNNYSFEIDINDFANNWYIHVDDTKCKYVVELGRRPNQSNEIYNVQNNEPTQFVKILSSNEIENPNDHVLFYEDNQKLYFKNVKTNAITEKRIDKKQTKHLAEIYKYFSFANDSANNKFDFENPSSNSPTSNVM